jgi:dephospho-CoA kinase
MNRKRVLGLVGGMGSGKTLVAGELVKRGAHLIAGDALGHEALRRPEIRDAATRRWGSAILNDHGDIDRAKLGRIVFADPAQRRSLEMMSFPYIERRIREEIEAARVEQGAGLIVLDAAVMFEAGWNQYCDWIVFVEAPRADRLRRLAEQRGLSEREVQAREDAQWPLTEKARRADFVVDNSGSPDLLAQKVDQLLERLGVGHN